jgi:uncharacterized protein (TIGR00251 family)
MPDFLRADATGAVLLKLRVHPGAKRSAVHGTFGDALKIELQAPPVDGKANAALLKFLAEKLSVSKSALSLKSGECSRDKVVRIEGLPIDQITVLLDV